MDRPRPPSPPPINPPNRYTRIEFEEDLEQLAYDDETRAALRSPAIEYYRDDSKSILTAIDSPDLGFRHSLNPYRGCTHGCSYCYARPTHEYFGLSAGVDFQQKIFVKERAAELFRESMAREDWRPETVLMSGVTDCYQPAERRFRLTRGCLEVALEARQPIAVVTKNALVTRDLDLLAEMARLGIVTVAVSVTTLDPVLARDMEPGTSGPGARLRAIEALHAAGVPVHVLVAPVIPGLTDAEIPAILHAAKKAGVESASYILLRLPSSVRAVFLDWLAREEPERKKKIEALIRSTRGGKLYEPAFGVRMKGSGEFAGQIGQLFQVIAKRHHLPQRVRTLDASQFRRPRPPSNQGMLFPGF